MSVSSSGVNSAPVRLLLSVLFTATLSSQALATESGWSADGIQVDLGLDDNGKTAPEAFIPFDWGNGWTSGLGFRSRQTDSNDVLEGFTDSRVASSVSEDRLRLNLATYNAGSDKSKWSFGADYEQITLDQLQFGYFQMPNPYTPNPSVAGEYVSFDSEVEVAISKPNIFADYTSIGDSVDFRAGLSFSPSTTLDVDQETRFIPLVADSGDSSDSSGQDLSYAMNLDFEFKTASAVNLGFGYYYEFLPMQYDLAQLNATADGFSGQTIDIEQVTTRMTVRLIFNDEIAGKLKSVLSYTVEDVETTDVASGNSDIESKNIISFGLENRF